ncbi:hypothetical protein Dsin_003070 [Dipteronia sinensis]|uniref:Uncharacterized protein n=1 Tax=Dipteronia sinensis TaxID=43782 RepID=A0AAE0EKA0_9ROSI|nr:hypothetical protein Dsin_003070 [Dipteronia sinensis]
MNQSRVHFSWENEPGVSKTLNQGSPNDGRYPLKLLPPPPCLKSENARVSVHHDMKIPLPPSRSFSRKSSSRKEQLEDPFMVALKECTKSNTQKGHKSYEKNGHVVSAWLKKKQKGFFNFSCKHSCSVVDDKFVNKNYQLPLKKNEKD